LKILISGISHKFLFMFVLPFSLPTQLFPSFFIAFFQIGKLCATKMTTPCFMRQRVGREIVHISVTQPHGPIGRIRITPFFRGDRGNLCRSGGMWAPENWDNTVHIINDLPNPHHVSPQNGQASHAGSHGIAMIHGADNVWRLPQPLPAAQPDDDIVDLHPSQDDLAWLEEQEQALPLPPPPPPAPYPVGPVFRPEPTDWSWEAVGDTYFPRFWDRNWGIPSASIQRHEWFRQMLQHAQLDAQLDAYWGYA
jgi:hypothetical protein